MLEDGLQYGRMGSKRFQAILIFFCKMIITKGKSGHGVMVYLDIYKEGIFDFHENIVNCALCQCKRK